MWIAVEGGEAETSAGAFDLTPSGRLVEFRESSPVGQMLPSGWYIIELDRYRRTVDEAIAGALSKGTRALRGQVYESLMCSQVVCDEDGREV